MMRDLLTQIPLQGWLGVGGGLVSAVVYTLSERQRAYALVRRWAAQQGLTINSVKHRTFVPFFGPPKGQFFRARVTDAEGRTRQCWLRFHHWAAKPEKIIVDWDA